MCEAYFNHLCKAADRNDVKAVSAGTNAMNGLEASFPAVEVMKEHNIDISDFQSSPLTHELIDSSDLIIALTSSHRDQIKNIKTASGTPLHLLLDFSDIPGRSVSDPFGGTVDIYRECFNQMKQALENLFLQIDDFVNN